MQLHPTSEVSVSRLTEVTDEHVAELADVLLDCVEGGASVGFMSPLDLAKALAFWNEAAAAVGRGERALVIAEDETGIVGVVQLVLALPENQPHRAHLTKMLVLRRARRQGVGRALLVAAESVAVECGRTLVVLDTVSGSDAERLYVTLGWQRVGTIPGYALWPNGDPCDSTVYYRELEPVATKSAIAER